MFVLAPVSRELEFRLQPRWIRNMEKPGDFVFGPVSNPFFVFWLVYEGSRTVQIDGVSQSVSKGDLIVFSPGEVYRLLPGSLDTLFRYFSLGCEATIGPYKLNQIYEFPRLHTLTDSFELDAVMQIWMESVSSFDRLARVVMGREELLTDISPLTAVPRNRLQGAVHRLFSELLAALNPHMPNGQAVMDPRMMKACTYIREHVHESIPLEELAAHVFLSPSHLNYQFRRAFGQPPVHYVRSYRIQRAKELLIQTSLSVKEIASLVGYEDQSMFSRAYRNIEGISPSDYRKNWQRNEQN